VKKQFVKPTISLSLVQWRNFRVIPYQIYKSKCNFVMQCHKFDLFSTYLFVAYHEMVEIIFKIFGESCEPASVVILKVI
jgi:hypothetical protein